MPKLGAELTGGKWTFKGQPVTIVMIIRTEDERKPIGEYVAKQLEDSGFTVDRQLKTAAEASPLWLAADPADGKMMVYTGGWISTVVNRDWGVNFDYYYTNRGRTDSLWQAYKPAADFDKVADRLARGTFKDAAERLELMAPSRQSLDERVDASLARQPPQRDPAPDLVQGRERPRGRHHRLLAVGLYGPGRRQDRRSGQVGLAQHPDPAVNHIKRHELDL